MGRSGYVLRALSRGAVLIGILQALEGIDFARLWTDFLATLFSLLVTIFLGGDVSGLLA